MMARTASVTLGDTLLPCALSKGLGSVSSLPHGNGFQRWLVPSNLYFLNKYLHFYGKTPRLCVCLCRGIDIPIPWDLGMHPGNAQHGGIPGVGLFLSPLKF